MSPKKFEARPESDRIRNTQGQGHFKMHTASSIK